MKNQCKSALSVVVIYIFSASFFFADDVPDYAKAPKMSYVAAGYFAKILCSAVFISHRDPGDVRNDDLRDFPYQSVIDYDGKTVSVSPGFGLPARKAIFREGLGSTLATNYTEEHICAQDTGNLTPMTLSPEKQNKLWPEGNSVDLKKLPAEINNKELTEAIEKAFTEPLADQDKFRGTRAVVVVYKGRIIAEKYAPGFTKDMPLMGWSMTKSITNAMIGIMVHEGKLSIKKPAPVPEWSGSGDPRGTITLDQLLRMSSGLGFVEDYVDILSDTPFMLFGTPDAAGFASAKPLDVEPDSRWRYISGSPNLVCRIIREALGGPLPQYFEFPRRRLFDRIGMQSAIIEPDATGTFIGSSFSYATARDWARFGLLYLQDGIWDGERILPEGWVTYSTTPTPKAPSGQYGAYWWLNAGNAEDNTKRTFPSLPTDLYYASGYEGQYVIVIPSRNIVLVRLGLCHPVYMDVGIEELVREVLAAIDK
ncbi:MAG: serine hydrolase [Candidatus Latescibacteria bacterium]|nr:serine hydrolase [Candidatus Latescibacterota bacterium]